MKIQKKCIKKIILLTVLFVYLLPALTKGEVYICFCENGEIEYRFPKTKLKTTALDNDWANLSKDKTCFFKAKFSKTQKSYDIKSEEPIPEEEDIVFRIPEDASVKFNGKMVCHSLTLKHTYHKQRKGTFVNNGIFSFIDTDTLGIKRKDERAQKLEKYGLHINDTLSLVNNEKIKFQRKTLLSLKEGYLINNGNIRFKREARIVDQNVNNLGNPLVFSKDKSLSLINEGYIKGKGKGKLGLFTKCFVSNKGRIQAQQIIMDWDGRNSSLKFATNIDIPLPSLKDEDKQFPILDIVRIPERLTQRYALDAGALGEEAACDFYRTFMEKDSFSQKSNSQDNGLDVIAYEKDRPTVLVVHESKNYHDAPFKLGDNQMTQSWVYGYLFRMYQDFLKESVRIIQTGRRRLPESQYNHIKNVLLNILHEDYSDDLKILEKWIRGNITPKKKKYVKKEIEKIMEMDASKMALRDYTNFFIEDLDLIPRGNSILHCEIPSKEDHGFNALSFKEATYFIRRDLTKTFEKVGKVPQPKG